MKKKVWDHALEIIFSSANKTLLKMKLTLCIILFSFLGAMATDLYSQTTKLSMDLKNTSVKEVLGNIENQSEYFFLYSEKIIDVNRNVNIEVHESTIEKILDRIFAGTNVNYTVKGRQIVLTTPESNLFETSSSALQQKSISGKVTDSKGVGLPGVSVVVKGTTTGVITDMDGKYTISKVAENAILQFSFVGMKTAEVTVGNKTSISVILNEATIGIEEVVAIGYGTQKKVNLTGSVVSTKGEEVAKSQAPNVINSLTGRLPGVTINSRNGEPGRENPSIYIRGRSTTGNSNPLIIVDGVERGNLGLINPEDIESVTVLKDASAAIYGARAANGVILVTTKRGGEAKKPTFNFTYNQGLSQPTRNVKMADSYTFAKVYNEIEVGAGRPAKYTDDELQKYKDGTDPNYANTDWYSFMTKTLTPQHRANLSVTGGTEKMKYYFSIGEEAQDGQFTQSSLKLEHYNIRSNVDVKVTDWFKIGLNLAGRYGKDRHPYLSTNELYSHIFLYQPNWTPYWPGTNYLFPCRAADNVLNYVSNNGGTNDLDSKGLESTLAYRIDIPWVKGLFIDGTANYDVGIDFTKIFHLPTYVYYYNSDTKTYTHGRAGWGVNNADLQETYVQNTAMTLNTKINYDRRFGVHNVGVMLGYEQRQAKYDTFMASRSNYISTALPQLFAGSSDKNNQANNGNASEAARMNYFGRASYDYAGKYLAQFIFRYDGSQNFPKDKRFGFFPGVSLGWRLSEEEFMKKIEFINNLKIRGSYGEMGNDQVAAFQYLTSYGYGNNYVIGKNDVTGLVQTGVPNPNITWEVAKTSNLGIDATLMKGLLGVEFDLFKTRRSNILTKRTAVIPDYTGLLLPDENVGIVDNKGFELVLTHSNTIGKLRYSLKGNVSFARNKVVYADEAPAAEPYQLATGRPMGSQLLYNAIGIFQNQAEIDANPHYGGTRPGDIKYEDVNKDGMISSLDQIRINQTNIPEIVYGFNTSLQYKNFDLDVLLQGQENAKVNFGSYYPVMSYSLGNFSAWRAENHWSPENSTNATMPRASVELWNNNTNSSTQWLVNAEFLRLKNLEVGYNLPSRICEKIKLQKLRVYISGNNLAILHDHMSKMGFDPETSSFWYYPQQRTYNMGVNLTF